MSESKPTTPPTMRSAEEWLGYLQEKCVVHINYDLHPDDVKEDTDEILNYIRAIQTDAQSTSAEHIALLRSALECGIFTTVNGVKCYVVSLERRNTALAATEGK